MLNVNEIFGPTIQGEGKSAGKEVMFLRLSGCNLHCIWCDTPYTWNWIGTKFAHPKKFDPADEVKKLEDDVVLKELFKFGRECKAVVISGGEPLIQQKQLINVMSYLKFRHWWIEIETNGTVPPTPEIFALADQINCSPKLSNSTDPKELRVRPRAMSALVANPKVYFKFVIGSQNDMEEVLEYVDVFRIPHERVYLMPLGMTREELSQTAEMTEKLSKNFNFQFSNRLHVIQFGGVRGV